MCRHYAMAVDTTEIRRIGDRLRRQTTSKEWLAYLDATMPLLVVKLITSDAAVCPACEARRKARAETMRRYRAKILET